MRGKLISIFVLIKVLPLLFLAWFAWQAAQSLGRHIAADAAGMADNMVSAIRLVGDSTTQDAIQALDDRSREAIESSTTETARQIAAFLYERDEDILAAAALEPTEAGYARFLDHRKRDLYQHGPYRLSADGSSWVPEDDAGSPAVKGTGRILPDNSKDFHARPAEYLGKAERRPLFVEITYIGLDGHEKLKVTSGDLMPKDLRNIADPTQGFVRAEHYWPELQKLKPGQIYVSDVIGAYVPSHVIGPFTPHAAAQAGIPFEPEKSAYAGTENPVGKRFRGIVRWATPVVKNGVVAGYVTLALDHDHIRQFSDRLMPTAARYTAIADATKGNYAFLWDYKNRSISHPRDYFIVGYDPATGRPVTPWLDESLYREWQNSKLPSDLFLATVEPFKEQSLQKKPAKEMIRAGTVALDCRYLNFSPQCDGWNTLTEHGGSGSFLIYFSGLWKLTTAAAIPYYTGQYGATERGFGFVTIGANVDDFHLAATESGQRIAKLVEEKAADFRQRRSRMVDGIGASLAGTTWGLVGSTLTMIVVVIVVAILMAGFLTRRITRMIAGIQRFEGGDLGYRLDAPSNDEMGDLSRSFNAMADSVAGSITRLDEARLRAEEANRRLDLLAHFDALTGLPNRVLLNDRLHQTIVQSERRNQSLAVAYLDLDGFKEVNDQYGHDVGDELLNVVARRMKETMREGDTLARIGGDEFIAVLIDLDPQQKCEPMLARLLRAAADPVTVGHAVLQVSASIGVTLYPQDGADADQLIRHADQAMYQAKQSGKNRYHLFDLDQETAAKTLRANLDDFDRALAQGEFVLHYQPKVNMKTGLVIGAEALIRWQHPERGLLYPAAFLPLIEEQSVNVAVGEWVIGAALRQMLAWHAEGLDLPVSVNVGARQLQQSDFVPRLRQLLTIYPALPSGRLQIEIVESSALQDIAQVVQVMDACREIGVSFALDDFGTGYSSLTYLRRLSAETVKIDRSFVCNSIDDPEDLAIIQGVIGLAAAFNREVIAEGVETVAHGRLLLSLGCERAQGYGIARPMPGAALPGWVANWGPDPEWSELCQTMDA